MRCQTFNAPLGVKPVIAPSRGCANHHFSGGYDLRTEKRMYFEKTTIKALRKRKKLGADCYRFVV
jgi:hypothetical protein